MDLNKVSAKLDRINKDESKPKTTPVKKVARALMRNVRGAVNGLLTLGKTEAGTVDFLGHTMPEAKAAELKLFMEQIHVHEDDFRDWIRVRNGAVHVVFPLEPLVFFSNLPELTSIPDNTHFQYGLRISDCPKLRRLPRNLHLKGNLILADLDNLEYIEEGLHVGRGALEIVRCPQFRGIGKNAQIKGGLNLAHLPLFTDLPEGLTITRFEAVNCAGLVRLPARLKILNKGGDESRIIKCPSLKEIPGDLVVDNLYLDDVPSLDPLPQTIVTGELWAITYPHPVTKEFILSIKKYTRWKSHIEGVNDNMSEMECLTYLMNSMPSVAVRVYEHPQEFSYLSPHDLFLAQEHAVGCIHPVFKDIRRAFVDGAEMSPELRDYFEDRSTDDSKRMLDFVHFVVRICIDQIKVETQALLDNKVANGGAAATVRKIKAMNREKSMRLTTLLPNQLIESVTHMLNPEDKNAFLELLNQ